MEIKENNLKELIEKYMSIEETEENHEELHQLGHEIDNVNVAIYTKPFGIDELAAAVFPTLTTVAETVAKAISGAPEFEVDFSELIDPM